MQRSSVFEVIDEDEGWAFPVDERAARGLVASERLEGDTGLRSRIHPFSILNHGGFRSLRQSWDSPLNL